MSYIQVVSPDLSTVGDIGYCLAMQENVWGAPHIFATATEAFDATQFKHLDRNFPDKPCPVWFSYFEGGINYGHVATHVPGQGVLSSPYRQNGTQVWFTDVDQCSAVLNCTYLGWSEDIANIRVIKEVYMPSSQEANDFWKKYIGVDLSPAQITYYTSKPYNVLEDDVLTTLKSKSDAAIAGLTKQVADLTAQLKNVPVPAPADPNSVTVTQTGLWAAFKKFLGL